MKKVSILMVIAGIFFCLLVFKEFGANEEKVEKKAEKKIVIALEEQLLYVFEGDEQIYAFPCSTGKKKTPTPTGNFQVYRKIPKYYSKRFNVWVANWLGFTRSGKYGIHMVPYNRKGYLGLWRLGKPGLEGSHGCVRIGVEESKILYKWSEIGTKVKVVKNLEPVK